MKIVMSLCVERMSGDLEPFWRPDTTRLVVVVRRAEDDSGRLIACGIDPDSRYERAIVFDTSFAPYQLPGFVAAVMGGDKTVIERKTAGGETIVRLPNRGGRSSIDAWGASTSRPPSQGDGTTSEPSQTPSSDTTDTTDTTDTIEPNTVVIPDPGSGSNGPKKTSLVSLARKLAAAHDATTSLSRSGGGQPESGRPIGGDRARPLS